MVDAVLHVWTAGVDACRNQHRTTAEPSPIGDCRSLFAAARRHLTPVPLEQRAPARLVEVVRDDLGAHLARADVGRPAAGGSTINWLFIDHFPAMSRGHFAIRRLERRYRDEAVRQAYEGR